MDALQLGEGRPHAHVAVTAEVRRPRAEAQIILPDKDTLPEASNALPKGEPEDEADA